MITFFEPNLAKEVFLRNGNPTQIHFLANKRLRVKIRERVELAVPEIASIIILQFFSILTSLYFSNKNGTENIIFGDW